MQGLLLLALAATFTLTSPRETVERKMQGRVIGEAVLTGTFAR